MPGYSFLTSFEIAANAREQIVMSCWSTLLTLLVRRPALPHRCGTIELEKAFGLLVSLFRGSHMRPGVSGFVDPRCSLHLPSLIFPGAETQAPHRILTGGREVRVCLAARCTA